jgi:Cdc6-like AAA superfamily ATPase
MKRRRISGVSASPPKKKKPPVSQEQSFVPSTVHQREDEFDRLKKLLQIAEHSKIVGRKDEVRATKRFLISALQLAQQSPWGKANIGGSGTGGRCLYISGMPGTGKTSCLLNILKQLQDERDEDDVCYFPSHILLH